MLRCIVTIAVLDLHSNAYYNKANYFSSLLFVQLYLLRGRIL